MFIRMKKVADNSPEKFTGKTFDELDKVLIDILEKERIITPDMVRPNTRNWKVQYYKTTGLL